MPPISRHGSNMEDATDDGDNLCPLCMEEMDMTDRQFKPCLCGYQICVWCWHHIMEMAEKDNLEGRCPACRTPYDKEKIVTARITCNRLSELSIEKKQKSSKSKSRAIEGRKNLSNVRVLQRNLAYVVGMPANLADEETLERHEFFGQYGKILKLSISKPSSHYSQHSACGSTVSIYVTYLKEEDASRCIQAVNGYCLEGRTMKACLGTTKYCNAWLKNMPCNNPECLYLHDEGNREDSFTKEEMLAKFGSKAQHFHGLIHSVQRHFGVGLPPPTTEVQAAAPTSNSASTNVSLLKASLDVGSSGKSIGLPTAASWGLRGASVTRSGYSRPSSSSFTRLKASKLPKSAIPRSSFQTVTTSAPPMTITTAPVSVLGCQSSPELIKPTLESRQLLVGSSMKQANVKNGKTTVGLLQSSSNISSLASEIRTVNSGAALLSIKESGASEYCLMLQRQNGSLQTNEKEPSYADDIVDNHEDHEPVIKLAGKVDDWENTKVNDLGKNDMNTKDAGVKVRSISRNVGNFQCDSLRDAMMVACKDEVGSCLKISNSFDIVSDTTEACTCSVDASTEASKGSKDSLHDSLIVDESNIKLDVISECQNSGSEPNNGYLLPSSGSLKDVLLQSVSECSGLSADNSCQQVVKTRKELQYSGNQEGSGTGESKLHSGMIPMGFDIWSDGSPQDLADLAFGEKNESLLSPNFSEDSSPWKDQSSKQSRFHFARQQDSVEFSFPTIASPNASYSQIAPSSDLIIAKKNDREDSDLDVHKGNRLALRSEGLSDSQKASNSNGKASTYNNDIASPKLPLSVPPGFSLSTRASLTPPGFNTGKNMKAPGQAVEKANFASSTNDYISKQTVSSSSEIEFMDPAIMAVGKGKLQANLNDSMAWVSDKNLQNSLINSSWSSSLGFALSAKEYSRTPDGDLKSQVQQRALYIDACSPGPQNLNHCVPFSSFLPYLNECTGSARLLMPSYQDKLNNRVSKIGIQDLAYGDQELLFQQTGRNIWESWNRVGSFADATISRQRMAFNGIGNSNATHLYGDIAANKEIASRSFWDSLSLNGQNEQGQCYNQRIL